MIFTALQKLLEDAGYPVRYQVLADRPHGYFADEVEPLALEFCRQHALKSAPKAEANSSP